MSMASDLLVNTCTVGGINLDQAAKSRTLIAVRQAAISAHDRKKRPPRPLRRRRPRTERPSRVLTEENFIPAISDVQPCELARPFFPLRGQLGAFLGIVQQVDGRFDPQALRIRIF